MQTDPTPSGPRFLGKYEVLARLDSGGMAEIFLARARGLAGFEKLVVLKRILPHLAAEEEFVSMFLDEAKTTVALSHGNIVQVFDMGKGEDGDYFIAMEYVAGKNLRRLVRKQLERTSVPIDVPLAAWIASEILRGLDYAHRRTDAAGKPLGIVHRDLSPHNILISYEGEVKVADFGIAKAAGKVVHTETGLIRGKAGYMSPEQARAEELDGRSDLFSTGTLLYELLTGVVPFDGPTSDEILRNLLKGPPAPPSSRRPEIPAALDAIVLKALSPDRAERFPSADVFLKEIVSFLGSIGEAIGPRDLAAKMTALFSEDLEKERAQMAALPKAAPPPPVPVATVMPATPAAANATGRTKEIDTPAEARRIPRWAIAGAAIAIVGAGTVGGWYAFGPVEPTRTPTPVAIASANPTSTATPIAEESAAPTSTPHARPSPSARVTQLAIATPAPTPVPVRTGKLSVAAAPWAFVYVDDKPIFVDDPARPPSIVNGHKMTATPIQQLETKAGRHHVRVEQWDLDHNLKLIQGESDVDVPPDGEAKLTFRAEGTRFVKLN